MTDGAREAGAGGRGETANERFKRRTGDGFWRALTFAALLHFGFLALWPEIGTADASFRTDELIAVDIPPEIVIPPPPETIARPATPVVSATQLDDEITMAETTFEANPVISLPPPPTRGTGGELADAPRYVPHTVSPELRNRSAVARALERNYPPLLRDVGIGGTPTVWFLIDEQGRVERAVLHETSGYEQLDQAALNVARVMEFSPALNRDRPVKVWVSLGVVFQVQ
jgi:periplasmic protein TonB